MWLKTRKTDAVVDKWSRLRVTYAVMKRVGFALSG